MKPNVALVTGATGFIGSRLVKLLVDNKYSVGIIVRDSSDLDILGRYKNQVNIYYYDGGVASLNTAVAQQNPNVVFHLASLFLSTHVQEDITPLINSNVLFSTHLVEAMTNNGCNHLVNTGTSWQHFDNHDYDPVCLYAATKKAFEMLLEYYVVACDLEVLTLTLFDTYGPGDPRPKLMNLLKKISISGESLDMSPGNQVIDILHIDDVIRGFYQAANLLMDGSVAGHKKYTLMSEKPKSLRKLVGEFCSATGKHVNINWGKKEYREREVMLAWNRGEQLPGWKPEIAFYDGVRDFYYNAK